MIRVGQPVRAHADCPVRAPSTTRSRRRLISTREHASRVASDPRSLAVSVTGELIFSGVAYSAPSTSQQDAKADTHAAAQLQHLSTESPKVDPLTAAYTTPSRSSRECVTAQRWPQRPATSHARAQQCAPTPTNTQCTRGTASLTAAPPKVYVDSSDAEGPVQQQDLLQTEPAWTHQNSMVEAVATRPVGAVQTVAAGAPETDTRVTAQVHDSELQASAELGPATGDARVPSVQGVGVTQPTLGCPEPLTRAPLKVTKLGQPHLTEGSRASDASAPEQESASSDRPAPAVSSTDSAATRARAGACTSTMNRLSRPWAALQTSTDAMADDVDGAHDGPSDEGDLQACLQELGFSPLQAETLSLALRGEESRFANVSALRQRMGALEAALPGLDLVYLVRKDMRVLTTDPACAIRRLILFREALGDPDLCTLVSVAPQLLYGEEVEEQLAHTTAKLRALLPRDYPLAQLQSVIERAPTLIFRMDHYRAVQRFVDLPQDLTEALLGARDASL